MLKHFIWGSIWKLNHVTISSVSKPWEFLINYDSAITDSTPAPGYSRALAPAARAPTPLGFSPNTSATHCDLPSTYLLGLYDDLTPSKIALKPRVHWRRKFKSSVKMCSYNGAAANARYKTQIEEAVKTSVLDNIFVKITSKNHVPWRKTKNWILTRKPPLGHTPVMPLYGMSSVPWTSKIAVASAAMSVFWRIKLWWDFLRRVTLKVTIDCQESRFTR